MFNSLIHKKMEYNLIEHYNTINEVDTLTAKHYFSRFKYRGIYYVLLKKLFAEKMRSDGMKLETIAEIIYGNKFRHDAVIYLQRTTNFDDKMVRIVENNYQDWILSGQYPVSLFDKSNRRIVGYKLICVN